MSPEDKYKQLTEIAFRVLPSYVELLKEKSLDPEHSRCRDNQTAKKHTPPNPVPPVRPSGANPVVLPSPGSLLSLQIKQFGSRLLQALIEYVVDSAAVKTTSFNRVL